MERSASAGQGAQPSLARTSGRPCPDGPWLWGIVLGFPMFMTGGVLMLTLIGAPLGIPLFHAGLALMLSSKPCGK